MVLGGELRPYEIPEENRMGENSNCQMMRRGAQVHLSWTQWTPIKNKIETDTEQFLPHSSSGLVKVERWREPTTQKEPDLWRGGMEGRKASHIDTGAKSDAGNDYISIGNWVDSSVERKKKEKRVNSRMAGVQKSWWDCNK